MATGFDLRVEPWVPVRGWDTPALGLRKLFLHAHEVEDLALAIPPAAAALWRVLYAITYRLTGLDDPSLTTEQWQYRRCELLADGRGFDAARVEGYFQEDRFDLFDPQRPWLQDPRLAQQCPKPSGVNKLVIDRPSGSNQVWFGHFTDAQPVPLSPMEAAWYLLAQLYYGAAGRCATRTVGSVSEANSTAGPLRGCVSYHPLGGTLFESLLCGLTPPPETPAAGTSDLAPWERLDLPDPLGPPTVPSWPIGLLVGRARHAALLVPSPDHSQVDNAYLTWAWRQPALPAGDPYLMQRINKESVTYVPPADHTRALWRDLEALLTELPPEGGSKRPPVFDALVDELPEPVWSRLRVRAYGFEQDRQTRDKQWFSATTPPVLRYLREREAAAQARIGTLRMAGEKAATVLEQSLTQAWLHVSTPDGKPRKKGGKHPGPWAGRAMAYYWPRAERVFWDHVDVPTPPPARSLFADVALDAIDFAVGDQEQQVRVARAVAVARRRVSGFRKGTAA